MIVVNEISVLQSYDAWKDALKRARFDLLHLIVLSTFCKTARYHNSLQSGRQRNFRGSLLLARVTNPSLFILAYDSAITIV